MRRSLYGRLLLRGRQCFVPVIGCMMIGLQIHAKNESALRLFTIFTPVSRGAIIAEVVHTV